MIGVESFFRTALELGWDTRETHSCQASYRMLANWCCSLQLLIGPLVHWFCPSLTAAKRLANGYHDVLIEGHGREICTGVLGKFCYLENARPLESNSHHLYQYSGSRK